MEVIKLFTKGMAVTILMILVLAFSIVGTVNGQKRTKIKNHTAYERVIEREYIQEIRSCLNQNGFDNSGVTMTYITEVDEKREYTVTIHHKKIGFLTKEERKLLLEECQGIAFGEKGCIIFHKFLETEL